MGVKASKDYDEVLNLNIGGKKFTLSRDLILARPETKLAKLMTEKKLKPNYSDGACNNQHYFERSHELFRFIKEFYITGHLPLSEIDVSPAILLDELEYWQIPPPIGLASSLELSKCRVLVETFLGTFLEQGDCPRDLYFYSTPDNLPFKDITVTKEYEIMSKEMSLLLTALCHEDGKGDSDFNNKIPLKEDFDYKFPCPVDGTIDHYETVNELVPIFEEIYKLVWRQFWPIVTENIPLPDCLNNIIGDFLHGYDTIDDDTLIDAQLLRITFALYSKIIDGAKLFDDPSNDNMSSIARFYATRYLDKRGIKSEWKTRTVECRTMADIEPNYPKIGYFTVESPNYKCKDCVLKALCPSKDKSHPATRANVWYLHFPWGVKI